MTTFFASAAPSDVQLAIGQSITVTLTIGNTSTLIDGYTVRVYGLDPEWVLVTPSRLALFPGATGEVTVTMQLPENFPAGSRQLSLQVRSENDPTQFVLAAVTVDVAAQPRLGLTIDPVSVTGGSVAQYGMVVANHGNSILDVVPGAIDPEDRAEFVFQPGSMHLLPGEQVVVQAGIRAPRPWIGQPKVRVLTFTANTPERVESVATFVQRPRIGRWLVSLLGLLTVAAVFAAVLSHTLSGVVDEAKVDDKVVNEALAKGAGGGPQVPVDPAQVTGKVVSATDGSAVAGVEAQLYRSTDGNTAVGSAATASDGSFTFGKLDAGTYRIKFSGAGFNDLWYPSGRVFPDGADVTVATGAPTALPDTALTGQPGTVAGKISGEDLTGATATLLVPGLADPNTKAVVAKVPVSADGSFALPDVPTPANYQLVVERPGSAVETRDVRLGAAQALDKLNVQLRDGDGVITGHLSAGGQPLGGVTVVATDGVHTVTTVSLTVGDVGLYTLRNLATPANYTVTVTRDGYAKQSRTLSVDSGAPAVSDITLVAAVGSIRGSTFDAAGQPLGGVSVTVTGGAAPASTSSVSEGSLAGGWSVDALVVPRTYTVTFAKEGYVGQTRLVTLDGSTAGGVVTGIDAALVRNVGVVRGTVTNRSGQPVAQATVALTNGTTPRTVVTADDPAGAFAFGNVPPGSYTLTVSQLGAESVVQVVTVRAGETRDLSLQLGDQASLTGVVVNADGSPYTATATVRLYLPAQFPGSPAAALRSVHTAADGSFSFASLDAPADFVVAVYLSDGSVDAMDSVLVSTAPGSAVTVPTLVVRT